MRGAGDAAGVRAPSQHRPHEALPAALLLARRPRLGRGRAARSPPPHPGQPRLQVDISTLYLLSTHHNWIALCRNRLERWEGAADGSYFTVYSDWIFNKFVLKNSNSILRDLLRTKILERQQQARGG